MFLNPIYQEIMVEITESAVCKFTMMPVSGLWGTAIVANTHPADQRFRELFAKEHHEPTD